MRDQMSLVLGLCEPMRFLLPCGLGAPGWAGLPAGSEGGCTLWVTSALPPSEVSLFRSLCPWCHLLLGVPPSSRLLRPQGLWDT